MSDSELRNSRFGMNSTENRTLDEILEELPIGICWTDTEGVIKYVNKYFEEAIGYGRDEIIDTQFTAYIHPSKRYNIADRYQRQTAGDQVSLNSQAVLLRRDGSGLDVELHIKAITRHGKTADLISIRDITEQKKKEDALQTSKKVLQKLRERLQTVVDDERTRIAREIHDDIGQSLTGLSMDLALLQRELDKPDTETRVSFVNAKLSEITVIVSLLVGRVREIATELRLEVLDDLGLSAAIRWKIREFKERTKLNYRFKSNPKDISLGQKEDSFLFRIFTEAMTNIVRHAEAQNVEITIEQKPKSLIFQIADDGTGIEKYLLESSKCLGIYSMREYAEAIGAKFNISSRLHKGTSITVKLHLERQNHD